MEALNRLGVFWRRLPPNQRLLLGTLAAAFAVTVVSLTFWVSRPEYGTLFGGLDPADGSAIVDRLRADKVPYKVEDGGRTILVPENRVYETRLLLAGNGLPGSGTGYEILDTNKLGWTDFVQKLQYRRAMEGEIVRTIETLQEIQAARVHLVIPEPSLFIQEEKPATASVVVRLRAGARLQPAQVQGIVHLVSSAVEGLQPEYVTVLDTRGNLLSRPSADPLLGATADQISLTRGLEEQLTQKVQGLLEAVLGPGKSVVRIAAEMDFQKAERTTESFDAENPVIRSEEKSDETTADGGHSEQSTTNYEISKTVEHVVAPLGEVRRLTASVFVDGTYRPLPKGEREYVPRSPDEMQKFSNIIRTAIGFDAGRGDQLTVENIAFDTSVLDQERKEMEKSQRWQIGTQVGGKLLTVLLVAGLLAIILRTLRGLRRVEPAHGVPVLAAAAGGGGASPERRIEVPPLTEMPQVMLDNPRAELIQRKIQYLATESPDNLARLIRAWLKEEN